MADMSFLTHRDIFLGIACIALAGVLYVYEGLSSRRRVSLPPGPPGQPVIGNLTDMPETQEWETISAWRDLYGEWSGVCARHSFFLTSECRGRCACEGVRSTHDLSQ